MKDSRNNSRRFNSFKKQSKKEKLAKSLGIQSNQSIRSHKRLIKNGWSCSCFLCQKDLTKIKKLNQIYQKEIENYKK